MRTSPRRAAIAPMLATAAAELPAEDGSWAYEVKWDGVRAVVSADPDGAVIRSRNGADVSASYPELLDGATALARRGARPVVLDGEIVAFDRTGRPSFSLLQRRMHVASPGRALALSAEVPVVMLAFDALVDGDALLDRSYAERRARLADLGVTALDDPGWQLPDSFDTGGADLLASTRAAGLEGVVAKRQDSRYQPGRRSRDWVKVKHVRTQDVVVGGWRPGAGRRAGSLGSLLVGVHDAGGLAYAGHVGTGFSDAGLAALTERLTGIERATSPFSQPLPTADRRDARWVDPRLVGEVAYGEWTPEGRLRHPAWRGVRPDVDATTVRRTDEPAAADRARGGQ